MSWKFLSLDGSSGLGALKNVTKRWEVLQLLEAYNEETMSASLAIGIHPLVPTPLSLNKLLPIFTCHMLSAIIGKFSVYIFLLPLTQCLMSLGQNHSSYSTLLVEHNSFSNPYYIGVGLSCLHISTFALHKVRVLTYIVQHLLA